MASRPRPLSPHLQVYRWQIQMVTSILHRATGIVLAAGALIITAGLLALMLGPETWVNFSQHANAWYGQVIAFGWTWCFSYHLCNGIRHIVQDFAVGYSKEAFIRSSWLSIVGSLIITGLILAYAWMGAAS